MMQLLIDWLPAVLLMTPIVLIIIWDHKKTKKEDRARRAKEATNE